MSCPSSTSAGWKNHYSIYPATDRVVTAFARELAAYTVEKGTIRFPLDARVPEELIRRIAAERVAEIGDRPKPKRKPAAKRRAKR